MNFLTKTLPLLGIITLFVAIASGVYYVMFLLWSAIAVDVFGAPVLTYLQVVGVMVLMNLLSGGIRVKYKQ